MDDVNVAPSQQGLMAKIKSKVAALRGEGAQPYMVGQGGARFAADKLKGRQAKIKGALDAAQDDGVNEDVPVANPRKGAAD